MSEDTEAPLAPSTAVAVRPQRQLVADVIPIFDSARFEHYGRIASVMAQSTLVPATLRAGSRDEAIANCIQVVEFADRAGMSPFAVAQCASVVFGKLMFEGKLVDAMLQTKLGIELNCYYTGDRGSGDRRIYVTDAILTEEQYEALAPGKYPFGLRIIDGAIDEWKTFEKGGAVNLMWRGGPQSDDQLAYKGKRTWSRRYKPAVMLGVITDDEAQDFEDRRLEAPAPPAASFEDAPKPPRKPRKGADAAVVDQPGEGGEGAAAGPEAQEEATIVQDAEFEDTERPTTPAAGTETGGAPTAEAEPATSASASPAPEVSQEQTDSSPTATSEPTEHGSIAPRDTVYLLSADEPGDDGKIPTYKNGESFSRVKSDAKTMPPIFDVHAPTEPEPQEQQASFDDEASDPVSDTIKAIRASQTFLAGEDIMKALAASPGFKENVDDDRKRGIRLALWTRYEELVEGGLEGIEAHENFTAMRLFLEFGAKTEDEIAEQWTPFYRSTYRSANEGNQRAILDLMVARKAALRAPAS